MPTIRLTALGDSFVEGRGDPGNAGGYRGWVSRFAELLGLRRDQYLNLGAFQATTQTVLDTQLRPAMANKAPLIGVVVGVNDLVADYSPERFGRNLERIFGSLAGEATTVFTATYPDIPAHLPVPELYRALLRKRFDEANEELRAVTCRHGALLLDLAACPRWAQGEVWSADGLHPSPRGHQMFAEEIACTVAGLTGLAPVPAAVPLGA